MTSLGMKLKSIQTLKSIMTELTDVVSDEDAEKLNVQFALFNKDFVLQKSDQGLYELEEVNKLFTLCHERVKKEYTAKFMESMAMQIMFEESD